MEFYHYTKLQSLKEILMGGGSFTPNFGRYNLETDTEAELGFYFTDLPPETINSVLFEKIFGGHDKQSNHHQRLQAYLLVNVDGRSIEQSAREHVFLLGVSAFNLELEIIECGQRVGWQSGGTAARHPWDLAEYMDAFKKERNIGMYNGKECPVLRGMKIREN